jgi:hypothetical protein
MYYRVRYTHAGCARFISEDPIGWASGQTNNYAYVGGDPVSFTDPSGKVGLGGVVVGAIADGVAGYIGAKATGSCSVVTQVVMGALGGAVLGSIGLIPGITPGLGAYLGAGLGSIFNVLQQGQGIGSPGFKGFSMPSIVGSVIGGALGGAVGVAAAQIVVTAGGKVLPAAAPNLGDDIAREFPTAIKTQLPDAIGTNISGGYGGGCKK